MYNKCPLCLQLRTELRKESNFHLLICLWDSRRRGGAQGTIYVWNATDGGAVLEVENPDDALLHYRNRFRDWYWIVLWVVIS